MIPMCRVVGSMHFQGQGAVIESAKAREGIDESSADLARRGPGAREI